MAFFTAATLRRYLVDHPTILNFQWDPPHTLASSTQFTTLSILAYLTLTLLLSRLRRHSPPPSLLLLRPVTALHSLTLLLLSLLMSAGALLSLAAAPSPHDAAFCLPPQTPPRGPLFFWAHVFYLSKFLEFGDTLLILLSGGDLRRLTLLHVYHHATVVVMCRVWLDTSQSLFPVALATNSAVHVVMYGYYFLSAVGSRPRWKRFVTNVQIVQFVFSFAVSVRTLYLHFFSGGDGCSGLWGLCFNAAFNASLLALFFDFHSKSYKKSSITNDKAKAT